MARNRFFLGFSARKAPTASVSALPTSPSRVAAFLSSRPAKPVCGHRAGLSSVHFPQYQQRTGRNHPARPVEAKEVTQSKPAVHVKSLELKSVCSATLAETLFSTLLSSPVHSGIPGYHSPLFSPVHRPASASLSAVKSLQTSPLSRLVVTGKGYAWREKQPRDERKLVRDVQEVKEEVREVQGEPVKMRKHSQSWYSLPINPSALPCSPVKSALHVVLPCQRLGHQEGQDGGSRRLVRSYWLRGKRKVGSLSPSPLFPN